MPTQGHGKQPRSLTEQIEELRAKIALLEGDRKAYYESASFNITQNREYIQKLRKENKELRKKLSDCKAADDHVLNEAFKDKPTMRAAMKNKTGRDAITTLDYKVCDTIKRLNLMKNMTANKMRKLEAIQTEYKQMVKDSSDAVEMDAGESKEAQKLRSLENRLDKAQMKCNEAEHIMKVYEQMKAKLQQEELGFGNTLSQLEGEIKKCKKEKQKLNEMNNDAQISKESAQAELANLENIVYRDKKEREVQLAEMKKKAEETKMTHERIERRITQRGSMQQDELSPAEKQALTGEEQQQKISTYEEAFRKIKEATGVSDTKEVVHRFENQGETQRHLEELKRDSEKQIQRLTEEKEKLQQEFEEMKYSGEAKLSSGQRMLEEFESHLVAEEERCSGAHSTLDKSSKILVSVKAGVEHLADKLQHLKAQKGHVPTAQISPTSDEYVLDLLSTSEEKLLKLLEELDGKDLADVIKQMEEEEFHVGIEHKLPSYNTRIKLPQQHWDKVYDGDERVYENDEDDSGEDEDVLSRQNIKRQAQQIVDTKTKRKTVRKKKKTK